MKLKKCHSAYLYSVLKQELKLQFWLHVEKQLGKCEETAIKTKKV